MMDSGTALACSTVLIAVVVGGGIVVWRRRGRDVCPRCHRSGCRTVASGRGLAGAWVVVACVHCEARFRKVGGHCVPYPDGSRFARPDAAAAVDGVPSESRRR